MSSTIRLVYPAGSLVPKELKKTRIVKIGLNVNNFATKFNELTERYFPGTPIRCCLYYQKRNFEFEILGPTSKSFLLRAACVPDKAQHTNQPPARIITPIQLYEIAKYKMKEPHLKYMNIQSLVRCLAHQCKRLDITLKPHQFHKTNRSKTKPPKGRPIIPTSKMRPPSSIFVIK